MREHTHTAVFLLNILLVCHLLDVSQKTCKYTSVIDLSSYSSAAVCLSMLRPLCRCDFIETLFTPLFQSIVSHPTSSSSYPVQSTIRNDLFLANCLSALYVLVARSSIFCRVYGRHGLIRCGGAGLGA